MGNPATVGAMRQQAALSDSDRQIVIVSQDPVIQKLGLKVVRTYPDTTDQHGNFGNGGTFKIEVKA